MAGRSRGRFRGLLLVNEIAFFIAIGSTGRAIAGDAVDTGLSGAPASDDDQVFAPGAMMSTYAATGSTVQGTPLILAVTVNGEERGLHEFALIAGEIWTRRETFARLGLAVTDGTDDLLCLNRLAGIATTYNAGEQRLSIMAQPQLLTLPAATRNIYIHASAQAAPGEGLILNYDATAVIAQSRSSATGFTELRYFNHNMVLNNTGIIRTSNIAQNRGFTRLDSSLSWSWPDRRLTLRLGDTLTVPSRWTRTIRMGGIQIGTNNRLQPYLVTAPLPSFLGSATLPSKVDLFINGARQYSGELPAGPFELGSGHSRINGAGNAQLVLTDVTGRVTSLDFQIYDTPLLLREGLAEWSAEAGAIRRGWGLTSFDYASNPFGSANGRYGLTNWLTIEGHAEVASHYANGGTGAVIRMGMAGILSGSLGASRMDGRFGQVVTLGYGWTNRRFRIGLEMMRASHDYADLARRGGAPYPRDRDIAYAGFNSRSLGAFGLNYVSQRYPAIERYRYAELSWNKAVSRQWWLGVRTQKQLSGARNHSLFLTLTWSPDRRDDVSMSVQTQKDSSSANLNVRRAAPLDGGIGWNLNLWRSDWDDDVDLAGSGRIDYRGRHGEASAGLDIRNRTTTGFVGYRGSLVLMDGSLFAARTIYDSFALVSTNGIPDIPVSVYHRRFGATNEQGKLLVTGLNAYQRNLVSIDPSDLPATFDLATLDREAIPADRAGVLVNFPVAPTRSMLMTLIDDSGQIVPEGTRISYADGTGPAMAVGFDGQLYVEEARPGAMLIADRPAGRCHVILPPRPAFEKAGRVGNQTCSDR